VAFSLVILAFLSITLLPQLSVARLVMLRVVMRLRSWLKRLGILAEPRSRGFKILRTIVKNVS